MTQQVFFVNAFTHQPFGGNPAAVMLLDDWLPDATLQSLAAQHNLSETAFLRITDQPGCYGLRWFTPVTEVPLCGHATLASAHVLGSELGVAEPELRFETRHSGVLTARYADTGTVIDLPAVALLRHRPEPGLERALGQSIVAAARPAENPWQVVYELESEQAVRSVAPNLDALATSVSHAVIVTARGEQSDFVSRFFAPALGVAEDPVTGSAHCLLTPYWADKLGKAQLSARQLSARGGELQCALMGDRVALTGACVTYARAELCVELLTA